MPSVSNSIAQMRSNFNAVVSATYGGFVYDPEYSIEEFGINMVNLSDLINSPNLNTAFLQMLNNDYLITDIARNSGRILKQLIPLIIMTYTLNLILENPEKKLTHLIADFIIISLAKCLAKFAIAEFNNDYSSYLLTHPGANLFDFIFADITNAFNFETVNPSTSIITSNRKPTTTNYEFYFHIAGRMFQLGIDAGHIHNNFIYQLIKANAHPHDQQLIENKYSYRNFRNTLFKTMQINSAQTQLSIDPDDDYVKIDRDSIVNEMRLR